MLPKLSKRILVRRARSMLNSTFATLYPALRSFPRNEHQGMSSSLKAHFIEASSNLSLAVTVPRKRLEYMQIAQGHLPSIKLLLTLSKREKYITPGFYTELDIKLSEVQETLVKAFKAK